MELGQRLKAKRKEQKISAEYIAKELGVVPRTLHIFSNVETGILTMLESSYL